MIYPVYHRYIDLNSGSSSDRGKSVNNKKIGEILEKDSSTMLPLGKLINSVS